MNSKLIDEIYHFMQNKKTLQLATVDDAGKPNASYAPFIYCNDGYYILVSELARHAQNILLNPQLSLMIIEDEAEAASIHTRKRLTVDATAKVIDIDTARWTEVTQIMLEKLDDTIGTLVQLSDFHLLHLQPEKGLYVKGFGKAHHVSLMELLAIFTIE